MVGKQREIGLDVINEGEYTKGGDWLSYIEERFEGFEQRPPKGGKPVLLQGKDREEFADFYRYASERGTLFYGAAGQIRPSRPHWACTAPIAYRGQAALAREIEVFRAVRRARRRRRFSHQHRAGELRALPRERVLQKRGGIRLRARRGDADRIRGHRRRRLPAAGGRRLAAGAVGPDRHRDGSRRLPQRSLLRVEALNHALSNIPEERIRYHLCWGSWHGPHAYDLEMIHMVDIMLKVKAQAYLFEAANARHEHEYACGRR